MVQLTLERTSEEELEMEREQRRCEVAKKWIALIRDMMNYHNEYHVKGEAMARCTHNAVKEVGGPHPDTMGLQCKNCEMHFASELDWEERRLEAFEKETA